MSSILDALNKLEGEKERERAQKDFNPADIDPAAAALDLVEPDALRDSMTLRVRPLTLIAGTVGFLVLVVAIVAITVSVMVKSEPGEKLASVVPPVAVTPQPTPVIPEPEVPVEQEAPEPVAIIPPPPESAPEIETAQIVEEPAPIIQSPVKVESPALDPKPATVVVPEPIIEVPKAEKKVPVAVAVEKIEPAPPETIVVAKAPSLPKADPIPLIESIPDAAPSDNANFLTLPRFTVALQRKHGFDKFKINMINPVSDTNPYGNAIINREKIFENAYISGNQVKLIKVTRQGIALEVARTGEKYFHDF